MTHPIHPLCASSTDIAPAEFELLKLDIKAKGQKLPILLWNDQVIDGRHRLRACEEVGARPRFEDVTLLVVEADLPAYVWSLNERRRHNNTAQRIDAAIRQAGKPLPRGRPGKMRTSSHLSKTAAEIAVEAEVSTKSVEQFKTVEKQAAPEIQQAMMEGQISVKSAAAISRLSKSDQQKLAAKGIPALQLGAKDAAEAKSARVLGPSAYVGAVDEPTVTQMPQWKTEAVKAVESLYERNREQWNNPPPPPPRMVIDWVLKILREL